MKTVFTFEVIETLPRLAIVTAPGRLHRALRRVHAGQYPREPPGRLDGRRRRTAPPHPLCRAEAQLVALVRLFERILLEPPAPHERDAAVRTPTRDELDRLLEAVRAGDAGYSAVWA